MRNHIIATNVIIEQLTPAVWKVTKWRNMWKKSHLSATNVNIHKLSATTQPVNLFLWEIPFRNTLGRKHIIATNVNIQQMTLVIWTCTKEPTRVKYLTGAQQAAFPSLDTLIWNDTCWGIIPEKNLTSATSAIMLAPLQLTCRGTWESTIYWDLSSAPSAMQVSNWTSLLWTMHKLTM